MVLVIGLASIFITYEKGFKARYKGFKGKSKEEKVSIYSSTALILFITAVVSRIVVVLYSKVDVKAVDIGIHNSFSGLGLILESIYTYVNSYIIGISILGIVVLIIGGITAYKGDKEEKAKGKESQE